jgi:hypothetical protein
MSTDANAELGRGPIEGGAEVVTAADGTFAVPAIATGRLEFGVIVNPTVPLRPRLPESIIVRPGEVTRVEIPLENAVKVRGLLRVKGSARPVPGASIRVSYGSGRQGETVVSDKEGRYETYALSGDVSMHAIVMPENFVQLGEPWNERYNIPADVGEFHLPPIDVVSGQTIKGRLVRGFDWTVCRRARPGFSSKLQAFASMGRRCGRKIRSWKSPSDGPIRHPNARFNPRGRSSRTPRQLPWQAR